MSSQVTSWIIQDAPGDLTATEMLVLLMLAEHGDPEGGSSNPTIDTLSRETRCGRRSVARALASLVEKDIIEIQVAGTRHMPNMYRFTAFRHAKMASLDARQGSQNGTSNEPRHAKMASLDDSRHAKMAYPIGRSNVYDVDNDVTTPLPPTDPFDLFWQWYPRKDSGRKAARQSWDRAIRETPVREIMAGLDRWLPAWEARGEKQFIPHATTWLNQERWKAEPPPLPSPNGSGHSNGAMAATQSIRESLTFLKRVAEGREGEPDEAVIDAGTVREAVWHDAGETLE